MLHSGDVFDWSDLGRPSVDKHSTGGVGDKISLILAPAGRRVRRAGADGVGPRARPHRRHARQARVASPAFAPGSTPEAMRAQLDALGVVMVGQGADLAPADGKLYALRDVTVDRRARALHRARAS